jgi:hypothetical protein
MLMDSRANFDEKELTEEMIDVITHKFLSEGWVLMANPPSLAFISPNGEWINFINTKTGERFNLDRKQAKKSGFSPIINEKDGGGHENWFNFDK